MFCSTAREQSWQRSRGGSFVANSLILQKKDSPKGRLHHESRFATSLPSVLAHESYLVVQYLTWHRFKIPREWIGLERPPADQPVADFHIATMINVHEIP